MLNAVVSEPDAIFLTADVANYYLGTPLPRTEYVSIRLDQLPAPTRAKYDLARFAQGRDRVLFAVTKGMYGLPHAGRLAQERLIAHLAPFGYYLAEHTPALFLHRTRPVSFVLVVDDFGIKVRGGREHADHLLDALRQLYTLKVDESGAQYVGLQLDWDYTPGKRSVRLSMPGYVAKTLARFGVALPTKPRHAPAPYAAPVMGRRGSSPLTDPPDLSPPLSVADTRWLQALVGALLYYARAIDSPLLVRVGQLSSRQARPTENVRAAATFLLDHVGTYPDASVIIRASDMFLRVHSDASYLSEPRARSRAGGYHYLGWADDPVAINGAVHVHCSILDNVMSSAAEAEYGAAFLNASDACPLRRTLQDLGYPQGPTPIHVDNTCAVGLANDDIKERRTKSIDMRFHWVRDRVRQRQFKVIWYPGWSNLADFFTKNHPPAHHRRTRRLFVDDHRHRGG
jgi:hypothetical protein